MYLSVAQKLLQKEGMPPFRLWSDTNIEHLDRMIRTSLLNVVRTSDLDRWRGISVDFEAFLDEIALGCFALIDTLSVGVETAFLSNFPLSH